jgi:hypothetical protein
MRLIYLNGRLVLNSPTSNSGGFSFFIWSTMKYFKLKSNAKITEEDLKKQWRKIVLLVHPDKEGGTHEKYLDAQAEYQKLLNYTTADFSALQDSPESYNSFDDFLSNIHRAVREKYLQAYPIASVNIEICFLWMYVSCEQNSSMGEQLKSIGFFWGKEKEMYCWGATKSIGSHWNMDKIRDTFGSMTFESDQRLIA